MGGGYMAMTSVGIELIIPVGIAYVAPLCLMTYL